MSNYITFLVHHINDRYQTEDVKIIGIFDSEESVNLGISEASKLKGFIDLPENFNVRKFILDKTHWEDGFRDKADFPNSLVNDIIENGDLPISYSDIKEVYCLTHFYDVDEEEEVRYIGIYSTAEKAEIVISYLKSKPGFSEYPEDFNIDKFILNEREWKEGFISWDDAME